MYMCMCMHMYGHQTHLAFVTSCSLDQPPCSEPHLLPPRSASHARSTYALDLHTVKRTNVHVIKNIINLKDKFEADVR